MTVERARDALDVTVVIPTRDRRSRLARTLSSVLAQQEVALEVVVVDDGSADETAAMLAASSDRRLRTIRNEEPQRVAAARNQGIDAATTSWVAFLDDDDLWAPDKLLRQLQAARESDASWAYCGFVQVDEELRVASGGPPPPPDRVRAGLPFRNLLPAGSSVVVARRELLQEVGRLDPSLNKLEDWDLWIRLADAAPPACVPEPLVAYVEHAGMSSLRSGEILRELDTIDQRYRSLRGGEDLDRVAWYRWIGWSALRAGSRSGAVNAYAGAVRAGDLSSLARAAVAVTSPRLGVRLAQRYFDQEWAAAADSWLEPYRGQAARG